MGRWSLPSLNYRRGAQRIYLVLSVLWVGVIAAVSVAGRPDTAAPRKNDPVVSSVDPGSRGDTGKDWFSRNAPQPQIWDEHGKPIYLDDKGNPIPSFDDFVKESERSGDWKLWKQGEKGKSQSTTRYWEAQSALALMPPIVGYLLLFGILPWIGRGFRSTQA